MAGDTVLVDAGPLVALLSKRDAGHKLCAGVVAQLGGSLLTTWVVMAEAAWLLRDTHQGLERLLGVLKTRVVACLELGDEAAAWMADTTERYADLDPQLADLSLLYLAERERLSRIFTLDRRDFTVFRDRQGKAFTLIP